MVFGKLLRRLKGEAESDVELKLIVEGTIEEAGRHQPRTRLGPNPAPEEAYFDLKVTAARMSDGQQEAPSRIQPPSFSGDIALLDQFSVGDQVQITCSTATGRMIEQIERKDG